MTMDEKLDAVLDRLAEVRTWQAAHDRSHVAIDRDIAEHRRELYGHDNGAAGLKARLQTMELICQTTGSYCGPRAWWKDAAAKILVNITSGAVLGVLAWLLLVYRNVH